MKWLRSRLRWQLMLSYLPLIVVPVVLIGLVTSRLAEQGLTLLITQGAQHRAEEQAPRFAEYYAEHGSWSGVSELFVIPPRPPWLPLVLPLDVEQPDGRGRRIGDLFQPQQTLITDLNGIIIASDNNNVLGQALSASALARGAPIIVNGKQIGTLVFGAAFGILDETQRQTLQAINTALLISGVVSVSLAIGLGLWLSWQITRPAQQLMIGVRRLSTGEWAEPLEVHSDNEFGDLTRAFNTMASEVTRQQQLRRQMVADVAHDLRTPLSAMMLEIEAIEAGFQSPAEATTSLREEVTWLQQLVDDLRMLSLMDADQVQLQPKVTALYPFLCSVYDFWQAMAEEEGRCLRVKAAPDLPDVCIDPGRMRQVLGNLIDNAIRHTQSRQIILSAEPDGTQAVIRITDDGAGIAPDDLPHIFDRFYRADRSRQHDAAKGGSGLGLSIAQRLVELHHGQIAVQSTVGQGTTFTVRLPIVASESRHADHR